MFPTILLGLGSPHESLIGYSNDLNPKHINILMQVCLNNWLHINEAQVIYSLKKDLIDVYPTVIKGSPKITAEMSN